MAFPTIISRSQNTDAANTLTHPITMPSSILAGDLVIICFSVDASETPTVTTGTNWQTMVAVDNSTDTLAVFYKFYYVDGPETVVVTTTNEMASHICFQIRNYHRSGLSFPLSVCSSTSGSSTNADPPSHTPLYGTADYLWIIVCGHNSTVVASACDSNFSNLTTQAGVSTLSASISVANRSYNTGIAYNPAAFTTTQEQWCAVTIAI